MRYLQLTIATCIIFLCTTVAYAQSADTLPQLPEIVPSATAVEAPASEPPFVVDYTNPRKMTLGGIEIVGAKYLDKTILRSITGLLVGQEIDVPGEDISRALRNLWRQGLFSDVEVRLSGVAGDKVYLEFIVTEHPRLNRIEYTGIKKSKVEEIDKRMESLKNKPLTEALISSVVNTIKSHYAEKGFSNVQVTTTERPDEILLNTSILVVDINRGSKTKIEEIYFFGVEQAEPSGLRKAMKGTKAVSKFKLFLPEDKKVITDKRTRRNFLYTLSNLHMGAVKDMLADRMRISIFKSSKFIESKYEEDKKNIIEYYNSIGYRDATIVSDTVYDAGNNRVKIELKIREGQRYYFRNIAFKGNAKFEEESLRRILGISKGDVYNRELLQKRLTQDPNGNDISSLYYDDGYLFFSINPVEVAVENDSIDLEIRINEGPQATIRNIIITGNDKTNEHVVRRELRTMPGDKFSRTNLIRSQREIANLGFFDPQQMNVIPRPNPEDGTVDIEYQVVEKSADQIELSAGWGGSQGLIGTLGLSFNNFSVKNMFRKGTWSPLPSGDGQKLSIRAQSNGKRYQSYNFSFTEPWLGGRKPNAFTIGAFRSRYQRLDGNRKVTGNQITNGASIGLGTRLKKPDDFFVFQTSLNYQNYKLNNFAQAVGNGEILENGNFNNLNLRFVLSRNNINQPLFPTSGGNISLSLQMTPPYSLINKRDIDSLSSDEKYKWVEYHKWRLNAEWYVKVGKKGVLKTSAKLGFMGKYNNKLGLSPFERFEVGGNGLPSNVVLFGTETISHRGYETSYSQDGGDPIFNKFTLELRYPFSLNPQATVYGLLFVEGANSYRNLQSYNPFKLNRSVGFGIRAFLPMFGLIGVDYGIRFDNAPGSPVTPANGLFDYIGKNGYFSFILGFEPD